MMADFPSYERTQFRYLGVSRLSRTLWRFVCLDWAGGGTRPEWPSAIGPYFRSRAEAMAALPEYGERNYPNEDPKP